MKKTRRLGFTIVELVIVIAVIGILAAVLIPTFSGIIESANRNADALLVSNINNALAIEDGLEGGVNEVVDIQKAIKKHGLNLKTKTKGAYLWYDRDNGKVVLGSLDANNNLQILSKGTVANNTAAVDSNGPALVNKVTSTSKVDSRKGKFDINMITLEGFIHGYYFISEESSDGFAEKICAVRNSDSENGLRDALSGVSGANSSVGQQFEIFMNTHPLITSNGVVFVGEDKSKATTAIVGSNVTKIIADVITQLKDYTNIDHVDLHPGVTAVDSSIGDLAEILFFHSSSEIDKANTFDNVLLKGERDKYIQSINLVYRDTEGNVLKYTTADGKQVAWSGNDPELNKSKWKVTLSPWLDSQVAGTANKVYDFAGYSFDNIGPASISLGTSNHFLTEVEKNKVNDTGAITIYAVYDIDTTPDFKIDDEFYSSRAVTYMLYDKAVLGDNIIVSTTDAVLDASLIGLANANLTIPSGVTLWVPCTKTDFTREESGLHKPYYDENDKKTYALFDTDNNATGVYKLEIASNVELSNEGYITVDAQLYYQGDNAHFGFISNNSGILVVNGKVINKGRLEAYGIIKTKSTGEIKAESGSTVVERMAFLDLHGGNNTMASITKNISPFNHFTVDSIRLPLAIEEGATYATYGLMSTALGTNTLEFKIAGTTNTPDKKSDSNPLFNMLPGSKVVKTYDKNEGIHLAIYGNVEDSKKKLDVEGIEIDFTKIPLPLANFDITIMDGATLSLARATYKVLPGSDIIVEEGGTLNINCNMVVYDSFVLDGNGKDVIKPRIYNTANGNAFTKSNATFTVKGTLVLQENAKFAGTILGDSNDQFTTNTIKSTIVIKPGAKTSCSQIKEGGGGKYYVFYSSINEYTVKDFDWKGKWQTGLLEDGTPKYEQITQNAGTTDITYEYTGGIWTTP